MKRLNRDHVIRRHATEATPSSASLDIARMLVGRPPVPVRQLVRETGITRTAIVEHLHELIDCGLVERHAERLPGRGRPRYVYAATPAALPFASPNHERLLGPTIWKALRDIGGTTLVREIIEHVSEELARHYQLRIVGQTLEARVFQMAELLKKDGHIVDVQRVEKRSLVLHNRSCLFINLLDDERIVCRIGLTTMRKLCGNQVHQVASRLDGYPCCVFKFYP